MAQFTFTFRRIEKKYLLTREQFGIIRDAVLPETVPDEFGRSTVLSLYLDTEDYRIIRSSVEALNFKEKLRIRSYGTTTPESRVFLEVKRKYNDVVYKRRTGLSWAEASEYLEKGIPPKNSRIMTELDYTMNYYGRPVPAALIACERQAFFFEDNPNIRITFDECIRARVNERLTLTDGSDGSPLLPDGTVLMEFKTDGTMPLWLARTLSDNGIFPASFSKYGTAYRMFLAGSVPKKASDKGAFSYA